MEGDNTMRIANRMQKLTQFDDKMKEKYQDMFKLTRDQIEELHQCFLLFDKSGTGSIDRIELKLVFESMGHSPSETDVDMMMREVDNDGDLEIDFQEFLDFMYRKMSTPITEEDVLSAFEVFDKSKRGFIGPDEFALVMQQLGEPTTKEEVEAMMKAIDRDNNGMVGFDEFQSFYLSQSTNAMPVKDDSKKKGVK